MQKIRLLELRLELIEEKVLWEIKYLQRGTAAEF